MKPKHIYLATILIAGILCFAQAIQAQQEAAPPAPPAAAAAEHGGGAHKKTLWETIKEGGPVMFPIALCSVFTLYLIGDGLLRFSMTRVMPQRHLAAVRQLFRSGDYVAAFKYCKNNPSPFTNVVRAGVGLLGEGKAVAEDAMIGELAKENSRMQTQISYLSVIGVCSPMIGLLGTVAGMISAFSTLGTSGIGDPSKLAAAIGEVLVATASGLLIAIPAFGSFYWLRNQATKSIHSVQDTINSLFRKMPYDLLAGVHISGEELYAAQPNWITGSTEVTSGEYRAEEEPVAEEVVAEDTWGAGASNN